jgi:integrase
VFTADKGGVLRPSNFGSRSGSPAIRSAGLVPLRPHDLRHTAMALWIAAGAHPKEVSVRAGHTSVAFTLNRYDHLSRPRTTTSGKANFRSLSYATGPPE